MAFKVKDIDESQAPLLDHLVELRGRLMRCVLALGIAFAICFTFADEIFGFLVRPLTHAFPAGQGKLIYTKLYEAFFVELKVSLFAAVFCQLPGHCQPALGLCCTWPLCQGKEGVPAVPDRHADPVYLGCGAGLLRGHAHGFPFLPQFRGDARRFADGKRLTRHG